MLEAVLEVLREFIYRYWDECIGLVVLFFILYKLGNLMICRLLSSRKIEDTSSFKNGTLIGSLERCIVFIGVLIGEWSLVAVVIALKTIARYKELDGKDHSEYFLIGTMASLLLAMCSAFIFLYIVNDTSYLEELEKLMQSIDTRGK